MRDATSRKEEDCFFTVTPYWRTMSGSMAWAACTRLFTLTVAMSGSVPISKYTVIDMVPLVEHTVFM